MNSPMSLRILIAVTHLLGAGHLTRAAALARAFAGAGHEVTLVSGGRPTPLVPYEGVSLVQLPPVQTIGTDFKALLDENGQAVDETYLAARRDLLLEMLHAVRPHVLITELFPFGRRVLAPEFLGLLEAARAMAPRPLVACSIRDILVAPAVAGRIDEAHKRLEFFYDLVLVHGDPALAPLEASWPVDERVRPLLRYTGYVDEGASPAPRDTRSGILVSGGSSAASLPLYRTAIEAARRLTDQPWRILVGNGVPESDFEALRVKAPGHAAVERARRDFRQLLAEASASVSQAGYNTVVDILRTGVRPILVPFEADHETEQRLRAERLKALGAAEIVPEAELSADRLVQAVRVSLGRGQPSLPEVAVDGASRSVRLAEAFVRSAAIRRHAFDWTLVDEALRRAHDAGRTTTFWWRDDDAVADTPRLERLLHLARRYGAGLGLAVIPSRIEASLAGRLKAEDTAWALVHGLSHANHALPGEKKAEFGPHRPLTTMASEAAEALRAAGAALGPKLLPVFVPPWNRIAPDLLPPLPAAGYVGISAFGDRASRDAAAGLVQVNAHIDPVDWHGTRSLADPDLLIAALAQAIDRRIAGTADPDEPIGLLTHHLVQDEPVWRFCEAMLEHLSRNKVRLAPADVLFCENNWIVTEA